MNSVKTGEIVGGHGRWMAIAIEEAEQAGLESEVPVGAVIAGSDGELLARAHNSVIRLSDPTAHAEILALRIAGKKIGNYRLLNTTLYVTLEPCIMCMGAILHARVSRIVFGARDLKWGGAGTLYDFAGDARLNHHPEIFGGVLENSCKTLLQDFFSVKRKSVALNHGSCHKQASDLLK